MSGSTISLFHKAPALCRQLGVGLAVATAVILGAGCGGDIESRMGEVRALQDVGQFAASIEELREILTIDPDLPEANYRLGLALVQTGEPSRAVWPLQKASDSSEYELTAGILLSSTHFQTKNYDEAIRAADRVLEADPERPAALRIRANAYLSARRLEPALEDTTRLKDLYPDDYGVRALHATVLADLGMLEEAEKEHDFVKELGEESDDPAFRLRACLAPAVFAKEVLQDNEKARPLYEECAARNPTDIVALNHILGFFDSSGDSERGTRMVRETAASAPENLALQQTLASRLNAVGDPEGAEKVLLDAVDSFGSAAAYNGLADFYRKRKEPAKAIEAIEKVIELSGEANDALRFTHADVLIDLGEIDRAREVSNRIQQPTYAQLIRGRIELVTGNPRAALTAFEKGINAWPNNAGARFLAGIAARDLGDYPRAIAELREAVRSGRGDTEAALELARIFYAQGRYKQSGTFANIALQGPGGVRQSEPYVIGARVAQALGHKERAVQATAQLRDLGFTAIAARELALIERNASGPEASLEAIDAAGLDLSEPANLIVLQQAVENLTLLERHDEATSRIDAAVEKTPDSPDLLELRGLVYGRAGKPDEAIAAFEQALEIDASRSQSQTGIATLVAKGGDVPKAIELFDRAYEQNERDGSAAYSAAQLTLVAGDRAGAIQRLRQVVKLHPEIEGADNDLAWLLAEDEVELDFALTLAERAERRRSSPEVLDTLGWVHLKRGDADKAVEVLERAVAGRSDSPAIRYHLGAALLAAGDEARAREMLRAALEHGAFPEADRARAELARLES